MYHEVEGSPRMTANEACARYPDSFVVMRMDSMDISNRIGTALYIGDDYNELFSLIMEFEDPSLCGVIEGLNHRRSLGGIVVGA